MAADCKLVVGAWVGAITRYLGHRTWMSSTGTPQALVVTFPGKGKASTDTVSQLPPIGVVKIPMECTGQKDDWVFPASFRKELTRRWAKKGSLTLRPLEIEFTSLAQPPKLVQQNADTDSQSAEPQSGKKASLLRQTALALVEFDNRRISEEKGNRYPFEWVLTLATIALFLIAGLVYHWKTQAVTLATLRSRLRGLEERLDQHENEMREELKEETEETKLEVVDES